MPESAFPDLIGLVMALFGLTPEASEENLALSASQVWGLSCLLSPITKALGAFMAKAKA